MNDLCRLIWCAMAELFGRGRAMDRPPISKISHLEDRCSLNRNVGLKLYKKTYRLRCRSEFSHIRRTKKPTTSQHKRIKAKFTKSLSRKGRVAPCPDHNSISLCRHLSHIRSPTYYTRSIYVHNVLDPALEVTPIGCRAHHPNCGQENANQHPAKRRHYISL